MAVTPNAAPTGYNSAYTGPQIDAAVGAVLDKEAVWDEAYDGKLPAGGEIGQVLEKTGADDNAAEWRTPPFLVRPNLLDNWYFVGGGSQLGDGLFPINQRGQTIYNSGSGFSLDRWTNGGQIALSSDYTEFINTNSANRKFYSQYPNVSPAAIAGMTCTLSVLLDNNVLHTATGVVGAVGSGTRRPNIDFGSSFFAEQQADGKFRVCIAVATNTTLKVKAVKLELGSYQTLAHNEGTEANPNWVLNEIPDFGEELLKCQRYLQVISSGTRFRPVNIISNRLDFNVALVVPMAGTPTLQMGAAQFVISAFAIGAQTEEGFTYSIGSVGSSIAVIRATKANHGLTDARLAVIGGEIFLAV